VIGFRDPYKAWPQMIAEMDTTELSAIVIGKTDFDPEELRRRYRVERDKRMRAEANDQYIEVTTEFSDYVDDPYTEPKQRAPLFDSVDVAIIGGGFGGLLAGARLREAGWANIRIIEKAGDVGGTWYWNRYPGAMCDIESYVYLPLLEEMGYVPRHKYAFASEIFEYSKRIACRYNLYENACFQTGVNEIRWDEGRGQWAIKTDRGDRMMAKFVVMANGLLSRPKLPGIPGINDFRGHTMHTSRWDYRYTGGDHTGNLFRLADKRVGIIGTGATAIQCIPHLGESAKQLYVFQRTPSSVDVRNNAPTDPNWVQSLAPGWQQRRIDNFTTLVSGGDQDVDLVGDGWTDIYRSLTGVAAKEVSRKLGRRLTTKERDELTELADFKKMEEIRHRVEKIVKDPSTAASLKPWYRMFCKRPCFHDGYLQTYNRANVTLVDTDGRGVERLTENSVIVGGKEYRVDCLIFATGFEVGTPFTRRIGYEIIGRDGRLLSDSWADGPRTLHGMQSSGFPNCFILGYTQTAVTLNAPHGLNEQAKHIAYILDVARRMGARTVEATAEGERAWNDEMREKSKFNVEFFASCTPGYINSEGDLHNPNSYFAGLYGGGPLKFFELLRAWRDDGSLAGLELRT
jgi:cation diffusion facilitator CzcD-associated flavoprotein CzcO